MTEQQIQRVLMAWLRRQHPREADWVHHSPNGGYRAKSTASALKAAGTRKGFPDLIYPIRRGGFCGLVLELKAPKGRLSPEQTVWLDLFARQGWHSSVAIGFEAAKDTLDTYLKLPRDAA